MPILPFRLLPAALVACITLAACAAAPVKPDASSVAATAYDQVRIVDARARHAGAPACVRVERDVITRIAPAGDRQCRRAAEVFELPGRYLLPGLIDMHAHLTLGPLEIAREGESVRMSAHPDLAIAEHNARLLVAFGVTTIRNPAGDLQAAAAYERRRASGAVTGPESFDAGPVIDTSRIEGLTATVASEEDVRKAVAAQVAQGADWIKLYTGLSPALLAAGIEAAHAHGRPAVAHLEAIAWPDALAMGLDGLVHLMPVSPDLLPVDARARWQATARPGAFAFFEWWEHFDPEGPEADRLIAALDRHRPVLDATLVAFHAAFLQDRDNTYKRDSRRYAHPALRATWESWFTFTIGWTDEDFRRARAIWPKVQRLAERVYASQARVTVGTDMSNPWIAPGISMHREMALLADAGVPPGRILEAATINAAEALGAQQRIGRIAEGYEADLLIVSGNPLEDIAHARAIETVVLDGRRIGRGELDAMRQDVQ